MTYPEVAKAARDAGAGSSWRTSSCRCRSSRSPTKRGRDRAASRSTCCGSGFYREVPTSWLGPRPRGRMIEPDAGSCRRGRLHLVRRAGCSTTSRSLGQDRAWADPRRCPIRPRSTACLHHRGVAPCSKSDGVLLTRTKDAFDRLYAGSKRSTRIHSHRRASLRHRGRRTASNTSRAASRLYQQACSRRGAPDRPANPRLVRQAGSEAGAVEELTKAHWIVATNLSSRSSRRAAPRTIGLSEQAGPARDRFPRRAAPTMPPPPRILADKLSRIWGQQVLTLNQPGASDASSAKTASHRESPERRLHALHAGDLGVPGAAGRTRRRTEPAARIAARFRVDRLRAAAAAVHRRVAQVRHHQPAATHRTGEAEAR